MKKALINLTFIITGLLFYGTSYSNNVDSILNSEQAPTGVVFEIVSGKPGILNKLLPSIKLDIDRLRNRYPKLPIAIVSHGREQFDLTSKNSSKYAVAHNMAKSLVKTNEVNLHICETHAGWYDINAEDFPDYVDVAPAGPVQINDYEELGYELIVLP